jgi:hypothetical protein
MEELLELKNLLLAGNVPDALILVEEMTEMSKDDKINKIFSFSIIVLLHLIKQQAENRSTRSWETSISNSVRQIQRINQRRKTGGNYLTSEELKETLYKPEEIEAMIDKNQIINQALALILID